MLDEGFRVGRKSEGKVRDSMNISKGKCNEGPRYPHANWSMKPRNVKEPSDNRFDISPLLFHPTWQMHHITSGEGAGGYNQKAIPGK